MTGGSAGTVIVGALIMAALAYKATDLIKYILALVGARGAAPDGGDSNTPRREALNGLLTLVLSGAVGIGVVMLMVRMSWSNEIKLGTGTLKSLSLVEQIVLGLVIASLAAVLFDFKKAIDRTDTASTPKLLPRPDRARRERVAEEMPPLNGDGSPEARAFRTIERVVRTQRVKQQNIQEGMDHLRDVLIKKDQGPPTDGDNRA